MAVVIGESAMPVVAPVTEPFAVFAAAKAEAGISERIEPAMLKVAFPVPHQAVMVTTAFFKSLPTAVLPVIALSAIVSPTVVVTTIVMPAVAVTVRPSPVLGKCA